VSHRDGDGDAFSLGEPVVDRAGARSVVGHAEKVRLITKSRRKDDRLDARTLARLARIDPELLSPVKHRSAQAQLP
jgi:transposase